MEKDKYHSQTNGQGLQRGPPSSGTTAGPDPVASKFETSGIVDMYNTNASGKQSPGFWYTIYQNLRSRGIFVMFIIEL